VLVSAWEARLWRMGKLGAPAPQLTEAGRHLLHSPHLPLMHLPPRVAGQPRVADSLNCGVGFQPLGQSLRIGHLYGQKKPSSSPFRSFHRQGRQQLRLPKVLRALRKALKVSRRAGTRPGNSAPGQSAHFALAR
jgi:hypothetical protein